MREWILTPPSDLLKRKSEYDCLNFLYRRDNVFVMDNHLAAGWCWLNTLDKNQNYGFIHIDQHNDMLNNNDMSLFKPKLLNEDLTIDDYTNLIAKEEKLFRWDNYILQIRQICPTWFKNIVLSTHKVCSVPEIDISFCPDVFNLYSSIHETIKSSKFKYILNLDLDYFFNSRGVRILTDDYIRLLIQEANKSLPNLAVITIAMSPECCGDWQNALDAISIIDNELSLGFIKDLKKCGVYEL